MAQVLDNIESLEKKMHLKRERIYIPLF